ncbi:MAG: hypothetical protein HYV95_04560 [Opitutae bacterium]|nr:hypothetical protein [Opitutae bacterium]
MKPTTPSPTPALLDRCNEDLPGRSFARRPVAQQEATLREGVRLHRGFGGERGAASQERRHKLGRRIPKRPVGYFKFDDELSALANRAKPSFTPVQR